MMAEKHVAQFDITRELLTQAFCEYFGMPEGTAIVHVEIVTPWGGKLRDITIYVEHPDLPVVREGEEICRIAPTISRTNDKPVWDWGKPDG